MSSDGTIPFGSVLNVIVGPETQGKCVSPGLFAEADPHLLSSCLQMLVMIFTLHRCKEAVISSSVRNAGILRQHILEGFWTHVAVSHLLQSRLRSFTCRDSNTLSANSAFCIRHQCASSSFSFVFLLLSFHVLVHPMFAVERGSPPTAAGTG